MKQTIGSIVRAARETKKMTREQLAKKLKISVGYVGHIECDAPVRISERVHTILIAVFPKTRIPIRLINGHNKKSFKYRQGLKS